MLTRLTSEQIEDLRKWFDGDRLREIADAGFSASADKISLLMSTISKNDSDHRPDDIAELTRLVAAELRLPRGLFAENYGTSVIIHTKSNRAYHLHDSRFDSLTPSECADVIQAEEAKRAQEWAGDPNG